MSHANMDYHRLGVAEPIVSNAPSNETFEDRVKRIRMELENQRMDILVMNQKDKLSEKTQSGECAVFTLST